MLSDPSRVAALRTDVCEMRICIVEVSGRDKIQPCRFVRGLAEDRRGETATQPR